MKIRDAAEQGSGGKKGSWRTDDDLFGVWDLLLGKEYQVHGGGSVEKYIQ